MAVRVWVTWLVPSLALALACGSSRGPGADPDASAVGAGTSNGSSSSKGGATSSKPPGGMPIKGGNGPGPVVPGGGMAPTPIGAGAGPGPDSGGAGSEIPDPEPGIRVLVGGDELHESYGTLQAQLVLTAAPLADVVISLSSSDPTQAAVYPLELTFTPENWAKPQNVFVSGVKDLSADGDQQVVIETEPAVSKDKRYSNLDAADIEVTVVDDTVAEIVVGPVSGNTTEAGGQVTFSVVLTSKPLAKVVIPLASTDTTEGKLPVEVVFDPETWSEPHAVTITGVDDALADGNQIYDIELGPVVSDDAVFSGMVPAALQVINVDNE